MPSPIRGTPAQRVAPSGDPLLDPLMGGFRWMVPTLTYSFPGWQATWASHGPGSYGLPGGGGEPWSVGYHPLSAAQQSDFVATLQKWAAVAGLAFAAIPETSTQVGDVRAALTHWRGEETAAAWAYYPSASGAPVSGDIWFNGLDAGAHKPWTPGTYQNLTLLHEMGHALGLKHPFDGGVQLAPTWDSQGFTVMSYSAVPGQARSDFSFYPTTPMLLDVAAIQHLYGANVSYRDGDDVYIFDDRQTRHETLWDAGGDDTLRYDGLRDAVIDLRAGEGSVIGVPVYGRASGQAPVQVRNVWLAWGVEMENAIGGAGADRLVGNALANRFTGRAGDDRIEGGGGIDVAVYEGNADQYLVRSTADGVVVIGRDGTDTLVGVERLQFADARIALDLDGAAGQAWRLYRAAFAREPDIDRLGFQIRLLEQGATVHQVAADFLASPEFLARYGTGLSDEAYVSALYHNVLHRAPDKAGLAHHLASLAQGTSRADVLACFSESPENQAALVGAAPQGLLYA